MGISWIPFSIENEMWNLLNEEGRRASCSRFLEFPDAGQEFVLCYCRLIGQGVQLIHFVDCPKALDRGV